MSKVKAPLSLRGVNGSLPSARSSAEATSPRALGLAAILATTVSGSVLAQTASTALPAVNVDAPREKSHPTTPAKRRPTAAVAARPHRVQHASGQASGARQGGAIAASGGFGAGASTFAAPADADPYADPAAPYKANRLSSKKFTEPVLNTPRTVTILTKEVLEDKSATTLREIGRSTAGVTLGTGEGGNAFGDRFFIRGFDARNDIFVDGIRDPGVSVRENFYTEQVEILRGPGSSFAGRGTAGGAINIVTKQAGDRDFYDANLTGGTSDHTKRLTLDVNKAISPLLAVRVNGLLQGANVSGRNYVVDDRNGVSASVVLKPMDGLKLTAEYTHVYLSGLPDFGVPYNRIANRPFTENFIPRNTYAGFVNRDFQNARQDFGTQTLEYSINENLVLTSKFREERSLLNYVGTLAEAPKIVSPNFFASTVRYGPQSRYQVTNTLANQTEAISKFETGPIKHAVVAGVELAREFVTRDRYSGLASELSAGGSIGSGALTWSLFAPPNGAPFFNQPFVTGDPTKIGVDTKAGYLIETANYQDLFLVNGGVRYDDYNITSRSASTWAQNHSGLVNYNAGVVFKPLPNVSLYGAYATSANPVGAELDGGAANYGGLTAASQIFAPQRNRAEEIGAKWELFDRHLLATAALFRTQVSGAREVNSRVTTGAAAYRVQGVDLEVAGKITEKWSIIGGLVLMDSKVTRSHVPTNVGLQLANIAHQSFSLLSKYEIGDMLEIGGQAIYASKIYGGNNLVANGGTAFNAFGLPAPTASNPFINVPTVLPSHWRFDAFAEMKVGPNFTMKVSVINVFNRTYYDAFYQTATPFVLIAPARTVLLEARARF
jgi:catecholate siderophore receptor